MRAHHKACMQCWLAGPKIELKGHCLGNDPKCACWCASMSLTEQNTEANYVCGCTELARCAWHPMTECKEPPMMGYFGVGVVLPKHEVNVGTLLRSAHIFGAAFVFTVGRRYWKQASDTTSAWRYMPVCHYETIEEMWEAIPYSCPPVAVELHDRAMPLQGFAHPERALYLLGPEDGSIPKAVIERCPSVVQIPGKFCLNVAVAGSIVMYDRIAKQCQRRYLDGGQPPLMEDA